MKTTISVPVWAIKASFNTHKNNGAYWREFAKQHATSPSYYSNLQSVTKHSVDDSVYRVGKSCQKSIYALLSHLDVAQCIRLEEEAREVYAGLVEWKNETQNKPTTHKLSFFEKENPQETFSELWNKLAAIQYDIGELTAKVNKLMPKKKKSFFNFKK